MKRGCGSEGQWSEADAEWEGGSREAVGVRAKRKFWLFAITLAITLAIVSGYTLGKDMALRDNARDAELAREAAG